MRSLNHSKVTRDITSASLRPWGFNRDFSNLTHSLNSNFFAGLTQPTAPLALLTLGLRRRTHLLFFAKVANAPLRTRNYDLAFIAVWMMDGGHSATPFLVIYLVNPSCLSCTCRPRSGPGRGNAMRSDNLGLDLHLIAPTALLMAVSIRGRSTEFHWKGMSSVARIEPESFMVMGGWLATLQGKRPDANTVLSDWDCLIYLQTRNYDVFFIAV